LLEIGFYLILVELIYLHPNFYNKLAFTKCTMAN